MSHKFTIECKMQINDKNPHHDKHVDNNYRICNQSLPKTYIMTKERNNILRNKFACSSASVVCNPAHYWASPKPGKEEGWRQEPLADADHNMLQWELNIAAKMCNHKQQLLNFSRADYKSIREELQSINWSDIFCDWNTDENWVNFRNVLHSLINKFVPCKKFTIGEFKKPPWMNNSAVKLSKKKNAESLPSIKVPLTQLTYRQQKRVAEN